MAASSNMWFRRNLLLWCSLLFWLLASTLLASLSGFAYVSSPSRNSCWAVESWAKDVYLHDQGRWYKGLAGTADSIAWESVSDFDILYVLYLAGMITSAFGVILSVKQKLLNLDGCLRDHTNALLRFFVFGFIATFLSQLCFIRNRCNDHNINDAFVGDGSSAPQFDGWTEVATPTSRFTKSIYLTVALSGSLLAKTLMLDILMRRALVMIEPQAVRCWMKFASSCNYLLLMVQMFLLPLTFVIYLRLLDRGIDALGGEANLERRIITIVFPAIVIVYVALQIFIAAVALKTMLVTPKELFGDHPLKVCTCIYFVLLSTIISYGSMAAMVLNAYISLPLDVVISNCCIIILSFVCSRSNFDAEEGNVHLHEASQKDVEQNPSPSPSSPSWFTFTIKLTPISFQFKNGKDRHSSRMDAEQGTCVAPLTDDVIEALKSKKLRPADRKKQIAVEAIAPPGF